MFHKYYMYYGYIFCTEKCKIIKIKYSGTKEYAKTNIIISYKKEYVLLSIILGYFQIYTMSEDLLGLKQEDIENMSDVGSDIYEMEGAHAHVPNQDMNTIPEETIQMEEEPTLNSTVIEQSESVVNDDNAAGSSSNHGLSRAAKKRIKTMMEEERISEQEAVLRIKKFNEQRDNKRNLSLESNNSTEQTPKRQNMGQNNSGPYSTNPSVQNRTIRVRPSTSQGNSGPSSSNISVQNRLTKVRPTSSNGNVNMVPKTMESVERPSIVIGHSGYPVSILSSDQMTRIQSCVITLMDGIVEGQFVPQFYGTKKHIGCIQFIGSNVNSISWVRQQLSRISQIVRQELMEILPGDILHSVECKLVLQGPKLTEQDLFKKIRRQNPMMDVGLWKLNKTIMIGEFKFLYLISIDTKSEYWIKENNGNIFFNLGMVKIEFKRSEREMDDNKKHNQQSKKGGNLFGGNN